MHYQRWKAKGAESGVVVAASSRRGELTVSNGYGYRRGPAPYSGPRKFKYVKESIRLAELALGKPLPAGAEVHHVDEDKRHDVPWNLVICESRAYHLLLHMRRAAYLATGDPRSRKCQICKQWGIPGVGDLVVRSRAPGRPSGQAIHRLCDRSREAVRRSA